MPEIEAKPESRVVLQVVWNGPESVVFEMGTGQVPPNPLQLLALSSYLDIMARSNVLRSIQMNQVEVARSKEGIVVAR